MDVTSVFLASPPSAGRDKVSRYTRALFIAPRWTTARDNSAAWQMWCFLSLYLEYATLTVPRRIIQTRVGWEITVIPCRALYSSRHRWFVFWVCLFFYPRCFKTKWVVRKVFISAFPRANARLTFQESWKHWKRSPVASKTACQK